jgi:hypothetical protein
MHRREDSGDDRLDISQGPPSRFGFPLAVQPQDSNIIDD